MNRLPVIAIVGRPNVGKSSLMNALIGKRISIVQDQPGVTRDRVSVQLDIDGRWVEMVDTGGYGFVDPDQLTTHIAHQIEMAMSRADMVLFVVDCEEGLTGADQEVATLLRRKGLKTVLLANKADGPNADIMLSDFARLGLGTPIGVSALRGRNIDLIRDAIAEKIDLSTAPTEVPTPQMHVAIVGKRNAGKSTLVNAIAELFEGHGDRVIVSEVPGTTRDSIDVRFEKEGKTLVVIDTAGVRKKKHMVTNDIEFYSYHRAQRSVRRADVVLLLIDATETVSEPDKKLARYVAEQFKPVVIVVNKWDLAMGNLAEQMKDGDAIPKDSEVMEKYREYLDAELKHLDFAPIAFVTAKEGKNVQEVVDLCQHLFKQAHLRISTSKLNEAIERIVTERAPSFPGGRRPKIYYGTQTAVAPPTIVLFVNQPEHVMESYQRYVVNRMRELLPFDEVPISLQIRGRSGRDITKPVNEAGVTHQPRAKRAGAPAKKDHKQTYRKPGKSQSAKPQPKKAGLRGASRGARPKGSAR
jgi:GTP-binding protein